MLIATDGGSKVSGTGVIERLNIQMDNGQTVYKNRTLTHNLQQPAQETNPLSTVASPGSRPAGSKSDLEEFRPLSLANILEA